MFYEIRRHSLAYSILLLILSVHVGGFFFAWPDIMLQRAIAVSLGFFYFLWGVTTHVKTQIVTKKIAQEYFLAGLLASVILLLLTM